jgi:hypothetical protein
MAKWSVVKLTMWGVQRTSEVGQVGQVGQVGIKRGKVFNKTSEVVKG